MSSIERPGINPKWLKKMKTWHKGKFPAAALAHRDRNLEELEHYVAHGIGKTMHENPKYDACDWRGDYHFRYECLYYAQRHLVEYESRATLGESADVALARRSVTAYYLHEMINYAHDRDDVGGGGGGYVALEGFLYAALTLVLGCRREGNIMARQFVRVLGGEQIWGGRGAWLAALHGNCNFPRHQPCITLFTAPAGRLFRCAALPAGHRGA